MCHVISPGRNVWMKNIVMSYATMPNDEEILGCNNIDSKFNNYLNLDSVVRTYDMAY